MKSVSSIPTSVLAHHRRSSLIINAFETPNELVIRKLQLNHSLSLTAVSCQLRLERLPPLVELIVQLAQFLLQCVVLRQVKLKGLLLHDVEQG